MSTATEPRGFRLDDDVFAAVGTIAVLLVVLAMALASVARVDTVTAIEGAEQTRSSGGTPFIIAGIVVVESLLLIGAYALYKRLSERWQAIVRKGLTVAMLLYGAQVLYLLFDLTGVAMFVNALAALVVLERFNLYWLAQNLAAVGFAAVGAVAIGTIIGPLWIIALLVLLLIWDRIAVTDTNLMVRLVEVAAKSGLPAYIVFAQRLQLDDDAVRDAITDDGELPDGVAGLIGTGDFVFPSALIVSVAIAVQQAGGGLASPLVVAPIIALIPAAGAIWMVRVDDAVPALPYLNTAVIAGFLIAFALNGGSFA